MKNVFKFIKKELNLFLSVSFMLFVFSEFAIAENDIYEPDNDYTLSKKIIVNNDQVQSRTLHDDLDVDWIKFLGLYNEKDNTPKRYTIEIGGSGNNDGIIFLDLFEDYDFTSPKATLEIAGGEVKDMVRICVKPTTLYFIQVRVLSGCQLGCSYSLDVFRLEGTHDPEIYGRVIRAKSGSPAENVKVMTDVGCGDITESDGSFIFLITPTPFVLKIEENEYLLYREINEALEIGSSLEKNVIVIPKNLDEGFLPIMKNLTGVENAQPLDKNSDINNDGKIGIEEALYILQYISGNRTE